MTNTEVQARLAGVLDRMQKDFAFRFGNLKSYVVDSGRPDRFKDDVAATVSAAAARRAASLALDISAMQEVLLVLGPPEPPPNDIIRKPF